MKVVLCAWIYCLSSFSQENTLSRAFEPISNENLRYSDTQVGLQVSKEIESGINKLQSEDVYKINEGFKESINKILIGSTNLIQVIKYDNVSLKVKKSSFNALEFINPVFPEVRVLQQQDDHITISYLLERGSWVFTPQIGHLSRSYRETRYDIGDIIEDGLDFHLKRNEIKNLYTGQFDLSYIRSKRQVISFSSQSFQSRYFGLNQTVNRFVHEYKIEKWSFLDLFHEGEIVGFRSWGSKFSLRSKWLDYSIGHNSNHDINHYLKIKMKSLYLYISDYTYRHPNWRNKETNIQSFKLGGKYYF